MLGLTEVFFLLFSGYEHNLPCSLGSLKGKLLIRRGFFVFILLNCVEYFLSLMCPV